MNGSLSCLKRRKIKIGGDQRRFWNFVWNFDTLGGLFQKFIPGKRPHYLITRTTNNNWFSLVLDSSHDFCLTPLIGKWFINSANNILLIKSESSFNLINACSSQPLPTARVEGKRKRGKNFPDNRGLIFFTREGLLEIQKVILREFIFRESLSILLITEQLSIMMFEINCLLTKNN